MALTAYQESLLQRLRRSFELPVSNTVNPVSDLVSDQFESAFRSRLLFHHTVTDAYLNKKMFEYAFRDAMNASGIETVLNPDRQSRSYDVLAQGQRISLKTEGSSSIKKLSIHISKLMECAWLRYVESNTDLIDKIQIHVLPHFAEYDRIVTLRIFRSQKANNLEYVLTEIPKALFMEIANLQQADFTLPTSTGTRAAKVRYAGRPAFDLRFDGSDEKITISNLSVDNCVVHASWHIPILFKIDEEDPPDLDLHSRRA